MHIIQCTSFNVHHSMAVGRGCGVVVGVASIIETKRFSKKKGFVAKMFKCEKMSVKCARGFFFFLFGYTAILHLVANKPTHP